MKNPRMTTVSYIATDPSALALKCSVTNTVQLSVATQFHRELPLEITFSLYSEGIERVEIVQMDNAVMATQKMDQNVFDITVTCQGR